MRLKPTPDPQLVLLRHGATEWAKLGKHTGRTDVPLLPEGEEHARVAGAALSDYNFAAVYASPLQRAHRTAELAGFPNPTLDHNLLEWDYGPIEGRTPAEISAELGREFHIFDDGIHILTTPDDDSAAGAKPHPKGETLAQVAQRAETFISTVEPVLQSGGDVLVVAHGHFLRVLGVVWLGLAPRTAALFELDTSAICLLGYGHGRHTLEGWNLPPVA